jgi:uncharacterized protein YhfF
MKKMMLILLFGLITGGLFAPEYKVVYITTPEKISSYDRLFEAVCMVESSMRTTIVNEKEQAYGIAQIRQIRLNDFNKKTNKHYTLEDCFNVDVSKEIFLFYVGDKSFEQAARDWNGRWDLTLNYWKKVQKYLK